MEKKKKSFWTKFKQGFPQIYYIRNKKKGLRGIPFLIWIKEKIKNPVETLSKTQLEAAHLTKFHQIFGNKILGLTNFNMIHKIDTKL